MRLGCTGCLVALILAVAAGAVVVGTGWVVARSLQDPGLAVPQTSPTDGARAQQKLFEIARRGARARGAAAEPVTLSEGEVNAFLVQHVAADDLPFDSPFVRLLGGDEIEFAGRLPLSRVLGEPPLSAIAEALPDRWLRRPVWLRARARVRVEPGARRSLRFDVGEFALGRQRLPVVLVRVLLDPASLRLVKVRLPDGVEGVSIERERVVIRTAS